MSYGGTPHSGRMQRPDVRYIARAILRIPYCVVGYTSNLPAYSSIPRTPLASSGALRWRFWNLPSFSLPVLLHSRAAAFFVLLRPLEDSEHHNADVGATVLRLPKSGGV